MSIIRFIIISLCLASLSAMAQFDPRRDLTGGQVLAHGECTDSGKPAYCVLVLKEKHYLVVYDKYGVKAVSIVPGLQDFYKPDEMEKVWERADA